VESPILYASNRLLNLHDYHKGIIHEYHFSFELLSNVQYIQIRAKITPEKKIELTMPYHYQFIKFADSFRFIFKKLFCI